MANIKDNQQDKAVSQRPTNGALESMTANQRWVFEQYLIARYDSRASSHEPLWLALVLAGAKPAASITKFVNPLDPENDTPPSSAFPIEAIAQTFDLPYRWWSEHELFVTTTPWRFDLLPATDNRTASPSYHRRFGCFFGYPRGDIEYFLSTGSPYVRPGELVAEGLLPPEELAYTTFVPRRHDDSIAGYERAIEIGKTNRETIADCAARWDLLALDAYADCAYHHAVMECLFYR